MPATSTADSERDFSSRGGQNFAVSFDIRTINGEPTQVRNFNFRGFTVPCAQGDLS